MAGSNPPLLMSEVHRTDESSGSMKLRSVAEFTAVRKSVLSSKFPKFEIQNLKRYNRVF